MELRSLHLEIKERDEIIEQLRKELDALKEQNEQLLTTVRQIRVMVERY